MSKARVIDGKAVAAALRAEVARDVAAMPVKPGLAVILAGDDPASEVYVRNKIRACAEAGIRSFESRLPVRATQAEITAEIEAFNTNPSVHGILLQLPLPAHLDAEALIQHIDPAKDVDGLTHLNQGKLMAGDTTGLVPCTPQGAMRLIHSIETDLAGRHAVVIGRSLLFGKPMGQLLLAADCTVTQAHSKTRNLPELCRGADILIAAAGRAEMVKGEWVKPGAIVIDVGITRRADGTLCGDVDYAAASQKAAAITPVPGGVGPMTIACLLANTVRAARQEPDQTQ